MLAAVATAMPETLIPVIAILGPVILGGGPPNSQAVGVGAILGAPFMLSTLAMFVTGIAIVIFARRGRRGTEMRVNAGVLGRDVISSSSATASPSAPPSCRRRPSWLKWVGGGRPVRPLRGLRAPHFTDTAEESDAEELNRLHLTRLAGRCSGQRDARDRRASRGALGDRRRAADARSSSRQVVWRWA